MEKRNISSKISAGFRTNAVLQLGPEDWPMFIEEIKPKLELNTENIKNSPTLTTNQLEIAPQITQKHKEKLSSRYLMNP